MDPQLKSLLGSAGLVAASSFTAWAAGKGIISSGDQATDTNLLLTLAGGLVTAGLTWWKTRQVTQKAMIQAVNAAPNGVKVVAAAEPAAVVNAPLVTTK